MVYHVSAFHQEIRQARTDHKTFRDSVEQYPEPNGESSTRVLLLILT